MEGEGVVLEQLQDIVAGDRFNPAHPGRHAAFADDLKQADVGGVGHMGAAAEFLGEVVHADHPHGFPVLFPKQGHGAGFPGLLDGHLFHGNGNGFKDLLVD